LLVGAALTALSMSAPAGAALFCAGKLSNVALNADGRVLLAMENLAIHSVCNTVTQGTFQKTRVKVDFSRSSRPSVSPDLL